jgi:hypothetical protein
MPVDMRGPAGSPALLPASAAGLPSRFRIRRLLPTLLFIRRDRVFDRFGRPVRQRRREAPAFEEPPKEPSDLLGGDRVDIRFRPDSIPAEDGRRLKRRTRFMIRREPDGHTELRLDEPAGNAGEVAVGNAPKVPAAGETRNPLDEGSVLVAVLDHQLGIGLQFAFELSSLGDGLRRRKAVQPSELDLGRPILFMHAIHHSRWLGRV